MAKHKKKPDTLRMDDHDDAHFPDNPAVAKPRHKKHVAVLSAPKMKAKRIIKKRVAGKAG